MILYNLAAYIGHTDEEYINSLQVCIYNKIVHKIIASMYIKIVANVHVLKTVVLMSQTMTVADSLPLDQTVVLEPLYIDMSNLHMAIHHLHILKDK